MDDRECMSLASRRHVCAYCRAALPEEPEERRRVFKHTGDQPVFWLVYRCENKACQRRTFVVDQLSLFASGGG